MPRETQEVSAFDFAVEAYAADAPLNAHGERILNDRTRAAVAELLHNLYPGWFKRFSLDAVERAVALMPPVRRSA